MEKCEAGEEKGESWKVKGRVSRATTTTTTTRRKLTHTCNPLPPLGTSVVYIGEKASDAIATAKMKKSRL